MLRGGDFTSHMDGNKEGEALLIEDNDDIESQQRLNIFADGAPKYHARSEQQEAAMRLYDLAKPERYIIILSSVVLLFTSAVQLTTPSLTGRIIDGALHQPNVDSGANGTTILLLILFGVMTFAAYLTYIRTTWQAKAAHRLVARLRLHLFAATLSQDAEFFDAQKTGDLLSRLSADADMVQAALETQLTGGIRSIAMSLGAAFMLLYISWSLALLALTTLPPTMIMARLAGRKMRQRQTQVRELHSQATSIAEQALTSITTVQQFVAESHELDQYIRAIHAAHYNAIQTAKLQAAFNGMVQIVGNGSMMCVLAYGGSLVSTGRLSAGALASFCMYSLIMAGNVSSLSDTWLSLCRSLAGANRVFEIMDRTPAIPGPSNLSRHYNDTENDSLASPHHVSVPTTLESKSTTNIWPLSVEFRSISFSYPARPDAQVVGPGFSLSIRAGEAVALVGASGGGKSTIAALLTRLYDVSSGAIYIDNVNICDMTPQQVREKIGIVSQEPLLFPSTIAENIRYGRLSATENEVLEAARLANVLEFSVNFPDGLETLVGPRGTQLSGGQKQRVAVARAILKNPPIVVFDEATSALDDHAEREVHRAINTAMKGRTVISISHRLSTIRHADTIVVISGGKIAEIGTFEELSAKSTGAFRELMKRQLLAEH